MAVSFKMFAIMNGAAARHERTGDKQEGDVAIKPKTATWEANIPVYRGDRWGKKEVGGIEPRREEQCRRAVKSPLHVNNSLGNLSNFVHWGSFEFEL